MTTKPTSLYFEYSQCIRLLYIVFLLCSVFVFAQDDNISDLRVKLTALKKSNPSFEKDTSYISLLNNLAGEYRFIKSDSTYFFAKNSYMLSNEIGFDRGKIRALKFMADYYSDKGKFKKAISNYSKALEISREQSVDFYILRLLNDLSLEYQYAGDFSQSLKISLEAIELAEAQSDIEMLSILNENLAGMYADQKDFEQALRFYEKVKKANQEIGNETTSAETMSNMAELYSDM